MKNKRKQVGVFSGSFNPIHMGHIMLVNYITEFADIDEVWLVVTPHNPLKVSTNLADENHRLEMCKLGVAKLKKVQVSVIEFSMPRPSFTIDTLDKLKQTYPDIDFSLIIGADNWNDLHKWKEYKRIRSENNILVYPRLNYSIAIEKQFEKGVKPINSPILEISSTFIRKSIGLGKEVTTFMPDRVYEYIMKHKLYQ